jgi:hypothetical protein
MCKSLQVGAGLLVFPYPSSLIFSETRELRFIATSGMVQRKGFNDPTVLPDCNFLGEEFFKQEGFSVLFFQK